MEKTLLWENPSPTTNVGEITATLNQAWNSYDYVGLSCGIYYAGEIYERMVIINKDDINPYSSGFRPAFVNTVNNRIYARYIGYVDNTHIKFSDATEIYGTSTDRSMSIPYRVYGINI